MDLMQASNQWSSRPTDERFETLETLFTAVATHKKNSSVIEVPCADLRVLGTGTGEFGAKNGGMVLKNLDRTIGPMNSWAFGQLCTRIGAPAGYLQSLPAPLAMQAMNYGLKKNMSADAKMAILVEVGANGNGTASINRDMVRAVLTDTYSRVWNADIVKMLFPLRQNGWKVPPARPVDSADQMNEVERAVKHIRRATADDVSQLGGTSGLSIVAGDWIQPAGLYCSYEDMFVFMVNEAKEKRIDDGTEEGLGRGFFLSNSEVGKASVSLTTFLYRYVCGNHIVWGASDVTRARMRHVGSVDERWQEAVEIELEAYANESASDIEAKIAGARSFKLADKLEDVIDRLFKASILSRKAGYAIMFGDAFKPSKEAKTGDVEEGYISQAIDGDPRTAWAFAQGITRYSQTLQNADSRVAMDKAAASVLDLPESN